MVSMWKSMENQLEMFENTFLIKNTFSMIITNTYHSSIDRNFIMQCAIST